MAKRNKHPEDDLQKELAKFLDKALPKGCVPSAIDHYRGKNRTEKMRLKARGLRAAFPDHIVIGPIEKHSCMLIELKTKSGRLTDSQKELHREIHALGVPMGVCRSVKEVYDFLLEQGVPPPQGFDVGADLTSRRVRRTLNASLELWSGFAVGLCEAFSGLDVLTRRGNNWA